MAQAQAACLNVGPRCLGVEDLGCDGRNEFYVCTAGTIGRSNVGSCVYTLAGMVICNCNNDKLGLVENCYFILVVERSFVIDCVARAFKFCMIQFLDISLISWWNSSLCDLAYLQTRSMSRLNRYGVDSNVVDLGTVTLITANKYGFDTQFPFFIYQKVIALSSGVVPTPSVRLTSTRRQPVLPLCSRSVRPARPGYSNRCHQVAPPRVTRACAQVPPREQHLHQTLRSLRLPVSF